MCAKTLTAHGRKLEYQENRNNKNNAKRKTKTERITEMRARFHNPRRNQLVTFNKSLCATAVALTLASGSAFATNGYFAHGYGTINKAMAGAGVALPQDAMAAATNPAGMAAVGDRMDVGAGLFAPDRGWSATSPAAASNTSDQKYFIVPHFAYNHMLDDNTSVGVAVYGNGGMNTNYSSSPFNFSATKTGVDLMQLFIAPTFAKKLNAKTSVGVSAIIAAQRFSARGLSPLFDSYSSDSSKLSDNGNDYSYGLGLKVGVLSELSDTITVGASYQSRTYMSKFDKYAGLFAEQGDFDIPATATIGLAVKANDKATITADVQHIAYGDIAAISNPISGLSAGNLGTDNGAGFGWDDMTIVKLGVQYAYSSDLTLRAGISHGDQPIPSTETNFNTLAPGVMATHITAGGTKQMGKNGELSFSAMYAPEKKVAGSGFGSFPNHTIKMHQFELEASYGVKW